MTQPQKDTIYVDVDDEITTIIDKLRDSSGKVVALVLPKRAATLQSIVNMKLLKRAADEAKKNLVLVTTEPGLLPLAGAVGLHVAKTPTGRPEIPAGPGAAETTPHEEEIDLLHDDPEAAPATAATAGDRPVGELAAAGAAMPMPHKPATGIETLELDNEEPETLAPSLPARKTPKIKKDHKLAVPNFDRFKVLLFGGGALLIALIVLGYLALVVLPKATILVGTNASNVNTNVSFTLDTTANSLSASSNIVPAKQVQEQKTYTATVGTTGQQNTGQKATGTITASAGNCSSNQPNDIPSGSGVSAGGKTYITQSDISFVPAVSHGHCTWQSSQSTPIAAQSGGAAYNTSGNVSFSVSGRSDVSASGSANGGTDQIQQVVSQSDIDSAKGKLSTNDGSIQGDLASQLKGQGMYPIAATYNAGQPNVTSSNKVGDAANNVTVTEVITYTMLGANQNDLNTLLDNNIKSQIDTSKQAILSRGLTDSAFQLKSATANGAAMTMQTVAEVGPDIDVNQVAKNEAGKKAGDITADLKSNPDVTTVQVKFTPFWVSSAPKNVSKITVTVAKPTKTANAN